jgi:hypothetical protein
VPLNEEAVNTLRQLRQQSGKRSPRLRYSDWPGVGCSSAPASAMSVGTTCATT